MPQLDKVTFLSQFFWLSIFYLGFYYLVLKYFLPTISRILTLRQKKINLQPYKKSSLQQENQQIRQNRDTNLFKGFSLSRNVLNDLLSRTTSWLDQSVVNLNKTHYKSENISYLHSFGNSSLKQNVSFYHASSHSPETLKAIDVLDIVKKQKTLSLQAQQHQTKEAKKIPKSQDTTKKSKKK